MRSRTSLFAIFFSVPAMFSVSVAVADTESPALEQIAVESVMETLGVSADEAARRLRLQDRASGIEDRIEAILGRDYAGVWYDHADRGRLNIGIAPAGSARVRDVQRIVDEYGLGEDAALVNVRYTLAELESRKAIIRESLMDLFRAGRAMTGYDTQANSVVVITLARLSAAEESRIRSIASQEGVVIRRQNVESLRADPLACSSIYCNPPMRGGRWIEYCTGGFTARHRVNVNDVLLLTAGHCVAWNWGNNWRAYNEAGVWKYIGKTSYGYVYGGASGMDAGAIKLGTQGSSMGYWFSPFPPTPEVVVNASSQTTFDAHYKIKNDSASTLGQTLCYSGGVSWTHCGPVAILGLDYWDTFVNSVLLNMGGISTCWPVTGDSGAPIYKINKAFGLLASRMYLDSGCLAVYQGIRSAENAMNVDVLLAP